MSIQRDRMKASPEPIAVAAPGQDASGTGKAAPGERPMTNDQAAHLATLAAKAGVTFDSGLSRAAASKQIDELQRQLDEEQPELAGGDGGTSIRANESASGEDETPFPSGTP